MVAIARKLLIVLWYVLMAKTADRRADAEQVAFQLMVWASPLTDEQRGGLTSRQFIRAHLLRLGLGDDLTHIRRGGTRARWRRSRRCWRCNQSCAARQIRREGERR